MEQRFYKVRLQNGRVIGPLDLARIKLFIAKDKITGLEMARLYPTGDWKDINTYPEIAEVLMQKLEGKLVVDERVANSETGETQPEHDGNTQASPDGRSSAHRTPQLVHTMGTPALALDDAPSLEQAAITAGSVPTVPQGSRQNSLTIRNKGGEDDEATMVITPDNERTMMVTTDSEDGPNESSSADSGPLAVQIADEVFIDETPPDPSLAEEKTAMLMRPTNPAAAKNSVNVAMWSHKKKIVAGLVIAIAAAILTIEPEQKPGLTAEQLAENAPVKVELPAVRQKSDPQKSEQIFKKALPVYYQDTVEGYKKAVELFKEAASWDSNNVRALCMLASSYMNLIDVVNRDDTYFNVVTRLIEMERAKNVDLAETVVADVELYHILGNPDAAFNRIVEFAKAHEWGIDMIYYLALSFYLKGQYAEALTQLNKIDPSNFFSPKISYLYGMIFEKNSQVDEAVKAYLFTIGKSPKHVKARVRLAALYFSKDNLPESGKQADYVVQHRGLASPSELARAYYFRARMHMVANRDADALADLEHAREKNAEDQDILLDYYTLKAKQGAKIKDAAPLARMFAHMAAGEKALKEGGIDEALAQFLNARQANEKEIAPLTRLADVFVKKGDVQTANDYLDKAVKLQPKNKELRAKYVRTLIQGFEFEAAARELNALKELSPEDNSLDRLHGELYLATEKWQEANTYLKKALGESNYDSSIYVAYARLMFKTNNFRDSAFYYGLALRFDPFNVEATVGGGKSIAELESLDKGVEYVQNALQNSPNKAALLNGIAEIYFRKGDHQAALRFADNALTTDSNFALAHKTKAMAYRELNKRKEAIDEFTSYSNLSPLDPTGHIELHKIYLTKDEKGHIDTVSAKSQLIKVTKKFPRYPGAHYMLADLYFQTGDFDSALFEAKEELKSNPTYIRAYVLAAMCLNKARQYQEALKLSSSVMTMAPNFAQGLLQAGIANRGLKSYAAAASMMERAAALEPGNPQIQKELGYLYADLQQYQREIAAFKKYLELYPDAPDKAEVEDFIKKHGG